MNKTAKTKQVEVKSKADFSAKVKVEGNFQMKLKSLTVADRRCRSWGCRLFGLIALITDWLVDSESIFQRPRFWAFATWDSLFRLSELSNAQKPLVTTDQSGKRCS